MHYPKVVAVIAIIVMYAVPSLAENAIPAKLGVADAISIAIGMNAELKQAEEYKRASLSSLRIANYRTSMSATATSLNKSFGSPDLTSLVTSQLTYESPSGIQGLLNISPLGMGNEHGAIGISLRKPLRKGSGALSAKGLAISSAQSSATIQSKELFLRRQSTVQGVVEAYYIAVLAREQVKVEEQAVEYAEQAADGWRKREKEGMVAGIDVARSEIQVSVTKNSLNSQQSAARDALDKLMVAIGGGVGQTPELVDDVPDVTWDIPSLGDVVKTALDNRAELNVYDERLAEQKRQLASAKDQLKPQLDLVSMFSGSRESEGFLTSSIFNTHQLITGIEYSVPLDKRITQEKSNTTSRQLDVLRELRGYQMEQIADQARAAYRAVESARASLAILAQNKTQAEENLRIANRMMEEGEGSSRDVLDAQQALTSVNSSILSGKTSLYLAAIDLKVAMGEDITIMGFK